MLPASIRHIFGLTTVLGKVTNAVVLIAATGGDAGNFPPNGFRPGATTFCLSVIAGVVDADPGVLICGNATAVPAVNAADLAATDTR
ncbi:hypothetical protein D3C72_1844300 [compost metagenome]